MLAFNSLECNQFTNLVTEADTIPFFGSVSTMTRFLLSCSCTRITFSVPLTMKYPPGSSAHSFMNAISRSFLPASRHRLLFSMIGNLPIAMSRRRTTCLARVYTMSTLIGAEYVKSRRRHSLGVISFSGFRRSVSIRSGIPIRISVYLCRSVQA